MWLERWYSTSDVLPACAGVIPMPKNILKVLTGFTRMRGGDPYAERTYQLIEAFYPHARG